VGGRRRVDNNPLMRRRDLADLTLLAALWGASFLFTRVAAPAFGPVALAEVRVAIAAAMLVPLLMWRADLSELRAHAPRFVLLGAVNTAIPFSLFAYAALSITAGLASILNATAPLFGALIARVWLGERLTAMQWIGLAIGMAGVAWLSVGKGQASAASGLAIAAGLLASVSYGLSASVAKRYFAEIRPLAVAAGSQLAAAALLAPFALASWPERSIRRVDWASAVALGVLCTGLAYILYFRLIARVGPARAMTVTFLIPAFAMLWGGLILGEAITVTMLVGCAVILVGTALATGLVHTPRATLSRP
jgi:drug/metabolite transporter (DMT)-like permease